MPRLCEPCRKHFADDTVSACPECGGAVKFTLLPPPGEDAAPIPGVPTKPTGRLGDNPEATGEIDFEPTPLSLAVGKKYAKPVGVLGAVLLTAFAFSHWLQTADEFDRRAAKLAVDISVEKAARIMGDDAADFPDYAAGERTWEGGTKAVTVRYHNGYVTAVEHGKARGLLGRRPAR